MWHQAGFRSGIISGRNSSIVDVRARQLGIEFVHQGSSEKAAAFEKIVEEAGVSPDEVAFIGDDLPDALLMPRVGLAVAVSDAHPSAKSVAHLITTNPGGRGAVRELIDLILEAKKH
jgi:3-deoxy-D-manno-octulosonate 8-phosphate phosphatase (KDO 8-P phosphatase)